MSKRRIPEIAAVMNESQNIPFKWPERKISVFSNKGASGSLLLMTEP
jgi:hypothetical protein